MPCRIFIIFYMKNFLSFFLLIFASFYAQAQKKRIDYKPEFMYPFITHYVNLENLQRVEADGVLARTFKTESKYALRFRLPFWFYGYPKKVVYKDYKFDLAFQPLTITDITTGNVVFKDTTSIFFRNFLVSLPGGIIQTGGSSSGEQYWITKYGTKGTRLFVVRFEHTRISTKGKTHYFKPYLNYFVHTPDYMVFRTYSKKHKTTYLLALDNGNVSSFGIKADGIIRAEDDKLIKGFIEIDKDKKTLKANFLSYDWTIPLNTSANAAETLLVGNVLVIATYNYNTTATKAQLAAYEATSGKLLWQAKVRQRTIGPEQDYNTIWLSAFRNKVIIEGFESSQRYLQIFDLKTGKKVYDNNE